MQAKHLFVLFSIVFAISGCNSSQKSTAALVKEQNPSGISFSKLFIVAVTLDIQARVRLEKEIVAAASANGYQGVSSLDHLPFSFDDPRVPTEEEIASKAIESGSDGVLIVYMHRKDPAVTHTKGLVFINTAFLGFIPGIIAGGRSTGPTETTASTGVGAALEKSNTIPGKYEISQRQFILESNLFDLATKKNLCTVKSDYFEFDQMEGAYKLHAANLVTLLSRAQLLRK